MKYLIPAILITFWIIGGILNARIDGQIAAGYPVPDKDYQLNHCLQLLLWIPTPLVVGLTFVLFPNRAALWLQNKVPSRYKSLYNRYSIFIIGLFFLALIPMDGSWENCRKLCAYLGK